jgi:hypothetical protein
MTRTRAIKSKIATTNVAFKKRNTLRNRKLDLNLKKKLVICCVQRRAVYRAKTWKLQKIDHKYFEISDMCYWRRMEKIIWTDRVKKK